MGTSEVSSGTLWTGLISSLAVTLLFYVLRSVGLYKLASKANVKGAWLSFIPFVWVYVACKLIGTIILFGRPLKQGAVIFAVIYSVGELLSLFYNCMVYVPVISYYVQGGTVYLNEGVAGAVKYASGLYLGSNFINPYGTGILLFLRVIYYLINVSNLLNVFIEITVFFGLFRKYWPAHYILATLLSVIGLFGIMVFVIRDKEPVDFGEYIRNKYYAYYGNRGANGYGGYNGYSGGANAPDEPFESGGTGESANDGNDDPFPEFDERKK